MSPMSCVPVFKTETKHICLNLIPLQPRTYLGSCVFYLTWFYLRLHRSVLSKSKITSKGSILQRRIETGIRKPRRLLSRYVTLDMPLHFFKRLYLFIFRERGREGEREGEKHQCVIASGMPPTGDLAHNPGMCPD